MFKLGPIVGAVLFAAALNATLDLLHPEAPPRRPSRLPVVAQPPRPRHPGAVPKVLLVGIDGCRPDALEAAAAPRLHGLIRGGAYASDLLVRLPGKSDTHTVSGPGWNTVLTGRWPHEHGIVANVFDPPLSLCADLFTWVHQARPASFSASVASWPPINAHLAHADYAPAPPASDASYEEADRAVNRTYLAQFARRVPDVSLVYYGQVDVEGHRGGFDPANPRYLAAIARVDALLGEVLDAVARRPSESEDWLILVTTDHGGHRCEHDFTTGAPAEVLHSFLIANGPGVEAGPIREQAYLVDVAPTALAYLGLRVASLPGRVRALSTR